MALDRLIVNTTLTDHNKYFSLGADGSLAPSWIKNRTLQESLNSIVRVVSTSLHEDESAHKIREIKRNIADFEGRFDRRTQSFGWKACKVWQNFLNLFCCGRRNPLVEKEAEVHNTINLIQRALDDQLAKVALAAAPIPAEERAEDAPQVIKSFEELEAYIDKANGNVFIKDIIISIPDEKIFFNDQRLLILISLVVTKKINNIQINTPIFVNPSALNAQQLNLLKKLYHLGDVDLSSVEYFYFINSKVEFKDIPGENARAISITNASTSYIQFKNTATKDDVLKVTRLPIFYETKNLDLSKTNFSNLEDLWVAIKSLKNNNPGKCRFLNFLIFKELNVDQYDRVIRANNRFDNDMERERPGYLLSLYSIIETNPKLKYHPLIHPFSQWLLAQIKTFSIHILDNYSQFIIDNRLNILADFVGEKKALALQRESQQEDQLNRAAIAAAQAGVGEDEVELVENRYNGDDFGEGNPLAQYGDDYWEEERDF